jgi:hypothetical protein
MCMLQIVEANTALIGQRRKTNQKLPFPRELPY